jgi:hypothetical protein
MTRRITQGAVFWRSSRVIAGITDARDLSSASSSLGARVNPSFTVPHLSRKSTRNARFGTLHILVTLFTDLDEFNMRCSHELSADEGHLLRSAWRRELPPSWCRSPRSPSWRAREQTIASSRARKLVDTCPTKALEGDWRFGNTRFSVNRYGDSGGCQLREHHGRGQFGYNRNCGAPHFYHP